MLLIGSPLPPMMPLDDVHDLILIKIHIGQAISPAKWGVDDVVSRRDRLATRKVFS